MEGEKIMVLLFMISVFVFLCVLMFFNIIDFALVMLIIGLLTVLIFVFACVWITERGDYNDPNE